MNKDSDRQADSGITREELKDMLQKYNIGKKPLSKLLGWGETTILLYLREDEEELPDNEYTRRLKNLYTHTTGFLSLLNKKLLPQRSARQVALLRFTVSLFQKEKNALLHCLNLFFLLAKKQLNLHVHTTANLVFLPLPKMTAK